MNKFTKLINKRLQENPVWTLSEFLNCCKSLVLKGQQVLALYSDALLEQSKLYALFRTVRHRSSQLFQHPISNPGWSRNRSPSPSPGNLTVVGWFRFRIRHTWTHPHNSLSRCVSDVIVNSPAAAAAAVTIAVWWQLLLQTIPQTLFGIIRSSAGTVQHSQRYQSINQSLFTELYWLINGSKWTNIIQQTT